MAVICVFGYSDSEITFLAGTLMAFVNRALAVLGEIRTNAANLRLLEPSLDKLAPFVGAGLSFEFGYPSWSQFLKDAADFLGLRSKVESLLAGQQFEEAAEALAQDVPEAFDDFLREHSTRQKLTRPLPPSAVRQLARIARGPVLTTNFDRVLEAAFEDEGRQFEDTFPGSRIYAATEAVQLNQRCSVEAAW